MPCNRPISYNISYEITRLLYRLRETRKRSPFLPSFSFVFLFPLSFIFLFFAPSFNEIWYVYSFSSMNDITSKRLCIISFDTTNRSRSQYTGFNLNHVSFVNSPFRSLRSFQNLFLLIAYEIAINESGNIRGSSSSSGNHARCYSS